MTSKVFDVLLGLLFSNSNSEDENECSNSIPKMKNLKHVINDISDK